MRNREFWLLSAALSAGLFIVLQVLVLHFSERGGYLWYVVATSWFLLLVIFLYEFFKHDDEEEELERYGIEIWNARTGPAFLAFTGLIAMIGIYALLKWDNNDLAASCVGVLGMSTGNELASLARAWKRRNR